MAGEDDKNSGNEDNGGDDPSDIRSISIVDEMERSYIDYAMSVIVSRALPDVRDGLKPVHRRILYSMHENGYDFNKAYRKSARVVGDVIGKYHPHGDQSIYMALVRMAQDFSMRLPLIDGQGNFGSVDGDSPAAMRYTEVRLEKVAHSLLDDLDKETVGFQDNYDNTEEEPTVIPAKFPNLLVNGAGGIAVGMATNIPPHNLGEVIDGCIAHLENPTITIDALNEIILGPDFPTGGTILGRTGLRLAYRTGRGSVIMRGKVHEEEIRKDRYALIVTEIPYQVNKNTLIEKIAELVRDKRVEGVAHIQDESDKDGMRISIELKRDAVADVILNQLYRFSPLQTSFGCNLVALNGGRPEVMNLRDFITAFNAFREEVITRRTKYLLNKARERSHILVGLAIAVANVDDVIKLIRAAPNPSTAREQLLEREWPAKEVAPFIALIDDPHHRLEEGNIYHLSDAQARAILELRLARLTALGRDEIGDELQKLADKIRDYLDILRSRERIIEIIRDELTEIKEEFGTERKTIIAESDADFDDEDLIAREDMVVTVSRKGYIKRVPLDTYRAQKRGGKGRAGMSTRDEDFVTRLFVANTHTPMLFFSSRGMVYRMKVWRLPLAQPQSMGKALINILPLQQGERITTIMPYPEESDEEKSHFVMFATRLGKVRRNALSDFDLIRPSGKIAMKLPEGDQIIGVQICDENSDVLLTSYDGLSTRFPVNSIRVFKGRDSSGVRGMNLGEDNRVISMTILHHMEATPPEARAYVKAANALRNTSVEDIEEVEDPEENADVAEGEAVLSPERFEELAALEQFILTVSENGFGKRTSSYEYRVTNRGGKGIIAMRVNERNGKLVNSFPIEEGGQIMLVTDMGKLIRTSVHDVRIAGRGTQGVTIFRTAESETVVAVEHIPEVEDDGESVSDEAQQETPNDTVPETDTDTQSDTDSNSDDDA